MTKIIAWFAAAILFIIIFAAFLTLDGIILDVAIPLNFGFVSFWYGVFFWARASFCLMLAAMIVKGAVTIDFTKKND